MNGEVNSQNVREYAPQGERPDINYDIDAKPSRDSLIP